MNISFASPPAGLAIGFPALRDEAGKASACRGRLGQTDSEGGMIWLESLIELRSLDSSFSSLPSC